MPPNARDEADGRMKDEACERLIAPQASPIKYEASYINIAMFTYFHTASAYGIYLAITEAKWATILLAIILHEAAIVGTTAGSHRLWAHRTYKAKLPLQILLMLLQSFACQYSAFHWARDHRLHHKFCDTDGDPHNATRGFFFSHIGWLLVKKHPEAKKRIKRIDMSDLMENKVLMFQKKYSTSFIGTICFILPTIFPMYFWNETFASAWHLTILRVLISLHVTFLVNSAAHAFGNKPYDRNITPSQSISISLATLGEGYHNFHHVFPWDYRAAELGNNAVNFTTLFIDFFAWLGWAYDLKTVGNDVIAKRVERTGDGTNLWGWGDKDMPKEHEEIAKVLSKGD
ncbi:acyl-CoA Delta(11) desaturase-like [Cydia amplana]|uniref:acyl-CoA Delta(11) desaturase-like n=1 Tax=Cydia amplana TaxID=1869771 RepID=UPI002FE5D4B0